jgi:transposase
MDGHSYSSRVEVLSVTDSGRRRRWLAAEKIRIVEESFAQPRAVSATARRHAISRSLLARWRAEYRGGLLGIDRRPAFSPVAVVVEPPPLATAGSEAKVEIVLTNGRRIVVPALMDPAALARLLPVVERA